jgi:hypothetical protein
MADTKPIELSLLPPSDGHSEGLRETGEGYSMAVPHGEYMGIVVSESDQGMCFVFDMSRTQTCSSNRNYNKGV